MGSCITKAASVENGLPPIPFPDFVYLRRAKKNILTIKNKTVQKEHTRGLVEIRNDAGIGLTSSQRIILAGGTDESGSLTGRVVQLDPINSIYHYIQDLPVPAKKGFIQEFEGWLYYVGALVKNSDVESPQNFVPSPLMRLNLSSSHWEVLETTQESRLDGEKTINYRNLYQPGTFIHKNKIYLVGGQVINSDTNEAVPNKKIYSINLHSPELILVDEDIKLKMHANHPICVLNSNDDIVQIFGGKTPDMRLFRNNFEVNLETKEIRETQPFPFFVKEHYPPIYQKEYTIIISFPKIAVQRVGFGEWKVFDFRREDDKGQENFRTPVKEEKGMLEEEKKNSDERNGINTKSP